MAEEIINNEEKLEINDDITKESLIDYYNRKLLEEQETNNNFESIHCFSFFNLDIDNIELKPFIKEILEVTKSRKKRAEREKYSMPDVKALSKSDIVDIYLQSKNTNEWKDTLHDVYNSKERSKSLIKTFRKNNPDLLVGFKEDSENVTNMVIERLLRKKINKLNAIIDERIKIINSDIKRLSFIKELIEYPKVEYCELEKNINALSADFIIKSKLLEKSKNFCQEQEKNRLIKEQERLIEKEKREKEIQEKKERARKEQEELEKKQLENEFKEDVRLFNVNGYEYVRSIIDDYEFLFPDGILDLDIEDLYNYEELRQIINFDFTNIDDEIFITTFLTILAKIDKSDDNSREKLSKYLKVLCVKYELYCRVKNILDDIAEVKIIPHLTKEELELLENFEEQLNEIKNCNNTLLIINLLDKMQKTIYNIKSINHSKNTSNEKVPVKAFVLFDYELDDNGCKQSYVTTDLDANKSDNMIDNSIEQDKIVSCGYNDFNELINDIFLLGNAEIMTQPNDKTRKIVRSVYYSTGYNKPIDNKKENATGMRRIRPRLTSYLRFIDEKVIFIQGTKKYMQIKNLIVNKAPGLIIDDNKPFEIFINYLDAFKKKDIDAYNIAKKRQKNSELRNILKEPCDEFSDKDLAILSDAIDLTLESFNILTNINDNFEFDIINQIKKNDRKIV